MKDASFAQMANAIRFLSMDAVEAANSGHPGMPMGMADVATVLFTKFLKFDVADSDWPDRDRFILSAGHGSMLLYSLLHLLGYEGMQIDQLRRFRQLGARTAGHPEVGHAPGIETTTGPLGQGIATAVGFAMAEAHLAARFGSELVDHRTWVIAGDGCLMEGVSQEAIALAGHLKLNKLVVLWDDNRITIDGAVSLADSTDQQQRFEASGWAFDSVDGHDAEAIEAALLRACESSKPILIACRTEIGKGAPTMAGSHKVHGSPLGVAEIASARETLGWPHAPFEIPANIVEAWRGAGARGTAARAAWLDRLENSADRSAFETHMAGPDRSTIEEAIGALKAELAETPLDLASRIASQKVLERLVPAVPQMLGGSADLTGSNNTRVSDMATFRANDYAGRYIHYGIREHGMAAAMNGLALHGGAVPYGGAFLVFSDYCRPSIRLSALMEQRVIYVLTHDSIALGEDGPTHQPVEHLAALRAIPNLNVFRPADVVETAECWEAALLDTGTPSILALTRQTLPQLRIGHSSENLCAKGGYVLREGADAAATLIATGSEVGLAVEAANMLLDQDIPVRVVSLPNWRAFCAQSSDYRNEVLGSRPRVAIEAALEMGWRQWLREGDVFVGMSGFGMSAPKDDLFAHFKLTADHIVSQVHAIAA